PDRHPQLGAQLAALHRRVRRYAQAIIQHEAIDDVAVATLIREIVTLRPDISSLAAESSSGPIRSAAARSAMVALVAELQAGRALTLPAISDPPLRERLVSLFDGNDVDLPDITPTSLSGALRELLRRDMEVR